ncbi:hypothetical protein J3F84DRAFT_358657, partial [Trichoderma pleuroticola]
MVSPDVLAAGCRVYNIEEVDQGQRSSSSQSRATAAQRIRRRRTRLFIRRKPATSGRQGRIESKQTSQWLRPVDQQDGIWRRSAQPADSGLSPLLGGLLVTATWEAGAPLRVGRERTRQERVRFGADKKEPRASGRRKKTPHRVADSKKEEGDKKGREQKR